MLTHGNAPETVYVPFLTTGGVDVAVHTARRDGSNTAVCTVIKNAGDDPDATDRAEIGARVELADAGPDEAGRIEIQGGTGVGRITLPGLEIPPGQPAINPGPRRMIRQAVAEVLDDGGRGHHVRVEVFVPEGEALAGRTLNARLGIVGGISILGTTGIVRPMSHEAYTATIRAAMSVARAEGLGRLALTTGRRSERHAQSLWPSRSERAFIQIGDFFGFSIETAVAKGIEAVDLAVFFGKAVKMAQGVAHTHASAAPMTLTALAGWTLEVTGDRQLAAAVGTANTARHAFDLIMPARGQVATRVGRLMIDAARRMSGGRLRVGGVLFDYQGGVIFQEDACDNR